MLSCCYLHYSFYSQLSAPQGKSGHEGVKKNLHHSDTRDRTRAVSTILVFSKNYWNNFYLPYLQWVLRSENESC